MQTSSIERVTLPHAPPRRPTPLPWRVSAQGQARRTLASSLAPVGNTSHRLFFSSELRSIHRRWAVQVSETREREDRRGCEPTSVNVRSTLSHVLSKLEPCMCHPLTALRTRRGVTVVTCHGGDARTTPWRRLIHEQRIAHRRWTFRRSRPECTLHPAALGGRAEC
jgi:hypothetical protein